MEDFAAIMEEAPGGQNHGRMNGSPLDDRYSGVDLRLGEGFSIVSESEGGTKSFTPNGRLTLPSDVYVDTEVLQAQVEEKLGFTYEQIASVYSVKRLPDHLRQLRDDIDRRMLALSRAGGNMAEFARIVGLNQRTMERALARARNAEVEA